MRGPLLQVTDYPADDVNVLVWTYHRLVPARRGQPEHMTHRIDVRVTHRKTGAVGRSSSRTTRHALAQAMRAARRRGAAYELFGIDARGNPC